MANPARLRRIAEQIRKELSGILHTELKDPAVGMVTITDVEVSPDLGHAKVYFTALGDADAVARSLEGLRRASGFLRVMLGQRIKIHNTPDLRFEFDASIERGVRLSKLIDSAVADRSRESD